MRVDRSILDSPWVLVLAIREGHRWDDRTVPRAVYGFDDEKKARAALKNLNETEPKVSAAVFSREEFRKREKIRDGRGAT